MTRFIEPRRIGDPPESNKFPLIIIGLFLLCAAFAFYFTYF